MIPFIKKHRYTLILAGIMLFALVCRIIRYYECDQLERDTFSYLNMARHWAQEKSILAAYRNDISGYLSCPPLLPGVMALGEFCGLGALTAGLWLNLFCGTMISLGVYLISIAVFKNHRYALYAALLAAVHPFSLRLSALVMRDTPYVAGVIFALAAGVWAVKTGKLRYWLCFGLCAAWASFCRKEGPELIFVFVCWCVWSLWIGRRQLRESLVRVLKSAVCAIGIFVLCTLPLQLYLTKNSHCEWDIFNIELLTIQYQKIIKGDFQREYETHRAK